MVFGKSIINRYTTASAVIVNSFDWLDITISQLSSARVIIELHGGVSASKATSYFPWRDRFGVSSLSNRDNENESTTKQVAMNYFIVP